MTSRWQSSCSKSLRKKIEQRGGNEANLLLLLLLLLQVFTVLLLHLSCYRFRNSICQTWREARELAETERKKQRKRT